MRLENKELMEEFYEQEKHKYPGVTLEEFKEICFAPWRFLKQEMESGDLPEVRFKYFGTFRVYHGRARHMLHNIKQRYKYNKIDKKQYFFLKEMLERYLKRVEDEKKNK